MSVPRSVRASARRTATSSVAPPVISCPGWRWPDDLATSQPADGGDGDHHRGDRQPPTPRRRPARRELGASSIDLTQHVGSPFRVAVAQRLVVGDVDVTCLQLGVEVTQRAQQEPSLVLQLGETIGVRHAHGSSSASAAATMARSSTVGSRPLRHRGATCGTSPPAQRRRRSARRLAAPTRARRTPSPSARAGCALRSWPRCRR